MQNSGLIENSLRYASQLPAYELLLSTPNKIILVLYPLYTKLCKNGFSLSALVTKSNLEKTSNFTSYN